MAGSLYTQVPSDPGEPTGAKTSISLWSHLTFAWLNRIFALGNTRPLEQTDLVKAAAQRDSKELFTEISKLWASEARSTSPRLLRAVARLFGAKDYAVGFLCLVVYAYLLVSQPIFLNFLLRELTAVSPNTAWIGLFLAGISLSGIVIPLVQAGLFYRGNVIGTHVSTALVALVYEKVSCHEASCEQNYIAGQVGIPWLCIFLPVDSLVSTVGGEMYVQLFLKVVLHWSTCNANLQRRFATHVFLHEFADMLNF